MSMLTRPVLKIALPLIAVFAAATAAHGADYPTRPIRVIVPFPAVSLATTILRGVSTAMAPDLGTSIVIENKPGGNTFIAMIAATTVEPDGYTLALATSATDALNPLVYRKLPYDPDKLIPLAFLGSSPFVLLVPAQLNVKSLAEFVQMVKAKPGAYNFASAGAGGPAHLLAEKLSRAAGLKMEHVQFPGSGPIHISMMRSDVHLYFDALTNALPLIRDGRLKALAIGLDQRFPSLPDLPTMTEAGYPGFGMAAWYALRAPRGTPPEAIEKLTRSVNKALGNQALRQQFADTGVLLGHAGGPKELNDRIAADRAGWAPVISDLKIQLD